ncbi:Uu.00g059410.m01.CDS01 [Anthostomella pinea]|uniref:Uu.00g059410.m01.CDS01 n=1 Tax=Anthostomella pinea TaxID=933095 RepID=A0AAI8VS42_9PEZI|nr:Uu.00g059410.m01.CDS01 [Anthostomella pinea]
MEASQFQTQVGSIPRRSVGAPAAQPVPSANIAPTSKKMRRQSSISSLLSAYSRTSSDSVHRSSQDSLFTKDSEPSYSPEREGMNNTQQKHTNAFAAFSVNPYADEVPQTTNELEVEAFPPPPPLKDPARPTTPSRALPLDTSRDGGTATSPASDVGGSPPRREIWRRRASSKSDRSLIVPELKLAVSHGSTAATAQPATAESSCLPPPPPEKNTPATAALPPRNASLPGRNIRPTRQADMAANDSPESRAESKAESEAKPEPPMKEHAAPSQSAADANTAVPTMAAAPGDPKESAAGKPISRRPVGPSKRDQPEVHHKISTPTLANSSQGAAQPASKFAPPFRSPRLVHSQSRSSLRDRSAPASHNVQETVMAQVPALSVRSPSFQNSGSARGPRPDQMTVMGAKPMLTPQSSGERLKQPGYSHGAHSTDTTSPPNDSTPRQKTLAPSRNISTDLRAVPLSDVNEAFEGSAATALGDNLTEEETAQLSDALARFPRNLEVPGSDDGVWPSHPVADKHFNCYARHAHLVFAKNTAYSLACQTCEVPDKKPRRVCSWCNLRICLKCCDILTSSGRDLKAAMPIIAEEKRREKGKSKEGDAPAAGANDS